MWRLHLSTRVHWCACAYLSIFIKIVIHSRQAVNRGRHHVWGGGVRSSPVLSDGPPAHAKTPHSYAPSCILSKSFLFTAQRNSRSEVTKYQSWSPYRGPTSLVFESVGSARVWQWTEWNVGCRVFVWMGFDNCLPVYISRSIFCIRIQMNWT